MKMRHALLIIAMAVTLTPTASANAQFYSTYVCANGQRFAMAFFDGYVSLQFGEKLIHVPQRVTLHGARYRTRDITLSVDGPNVKLTRKRQTTSCRVESRIG